MCVIYMYMYHRNVSQYVYIFGEIILMFSHEHKYLTLKENLMCYLKRFGLCLIYWSYEVIPVLIRPNIRCNAPALATLMIGPTTTQPIGVSGYV